VWPFVALEEKRAKTLRRREMIRARHFLVTRFNVANWHLGRPWRTSPDWLRNRFDLFERFCLPSVCAQTNKNFTWLVFFDETTPVEFRQRIDEYSRYAFFRPFFVRDFSVDVLRATILGELEGSSIDYVLTTRLDNDDAVSRRFIERVQRAYHESEVEVINFSKGYKWCRGGVYRHRDPNNSFATRVERVNRLQTIYASTHEQLSVMGVVSRIGGAPAWCQVIHEGNLANQLPRGALRVFPCRMRAEFVLNRVTLQIDWRAILVDWVLRFPYRCLRRAVRSARCGGRKLRSSLVKR
jgi:hypothetical protein